jgi:hypothetical protein
MIDPTLDRHAGTGHGLLNRAQEELRDALATGSALEWDAVPPIDSETRDLLSRFNRDLEEIAQLRTLEQLLEEIFISRSWRIGFALTRLWRKLVPSSKETAVDRWKRRRPIVR